MPGEARTTDFLLSTATLMVGPRDKLMELTPEKHSLGLIKNVQVTTDPQFVTLTQGVEAIEVASVNVANPSRISGEVYEYSARNLAYGSGIDASGVGFDPITTKAALGAPIAAGGDEVTLAAGSAATAGIVAGSWIVIQDTNVPDRVFPVKVASITGDVVTLAAGHELPVDAAFAVATTDVYRVHNIQVGSQAKRPSFGVKLVGLVPETGEPVTLLFPKVRITRGMSLAFQTDNFANMPFEFSPQALVSTDPFYADFGSTKLFSVFKR